MIEFGLLFDLPHSDGSHGCPILNKYSIKREITYNIVIHCLAVYLLKWGSMVGVRSVSIALRMTGKHVYIQ